LVNGLKKEFASTVKANGTENFGDLTDKKGNINIDLHNDRKQSVILMNQMELPAKNGYSELLQNYLRRLNVKYKRFFSLVDSKLR
jgi:hypothetical protein